MTAHLAAIASPATFVAALLAMPAFATPQQLPGQLDRTFSGAPPWTVRVDPLANLWFHGLAVVQLGGFQRLPLYDPAYSAAVRQASTEVKNSRLGRDAEGIGRVFRADSAFEVLHFVPLYFVGRDPRAMIAALRAAAGATIPASADTASLARTAAAVVAALPTARQRETLVAFLDALDDEWLTSFRATVANASDRRAEAHRLEEAWAKRIEPVAGSALRALGLAQGTILVSPALGTEGRITTDAVGGPVVAVSGSVISGVRDAPLYSALREMMFPLVRRVTAGVRETPDRVAAERTSDAATVRAGALVLERSPQLAFEYRTHFLAAAGQPAGDDARTVAVVFARAYPLTPTLERALADAVSHLTYHRPEH
jgi:hypothetical protein